MKCEILYDYILQSQYKMQKYDFINIYKNTLVYLYNCRNLKFLNQTKQMIQEQQKNQTIDHAERTQDALPLACNQIREEILFDFLSAKRQSELNQDQILACIEQKDNNSLSISSFVGKLSEQQSEENNTSHKKQTLIQEQLPVKLTLNKVEQKQKQIQDSQKINQQKNQIRKSQRTNKKEKTTVILQQSQESQVDIEHKTVSQSFLQQKVQFIIWKENIGDNEKFLVKFQGQSYLHCRWFTKDQLKNLKVDFNFSVMKSMQARMKRTINLKLEEGIYFNPNYTKVDRILTSTEQITSINHQLTNQIRGRWSESMYIVCSKLLNFMKDNHPYGVHFIDCFTQDNFTILGIKTTVSLSNVLNKILLGKYQNYRQIWKELGIALRNFETIYNKSGTDMYIVGQTMKQAIIFLYLQWYELSKQRFSFVKLEKIDNNLNKQLLYLKDKHFANDIMKKYFKIGEQNINIRDIFCTKNVLIQENAVDNPTNIKELLSLDPCQKTLKWVDKYKTNNQWQQYEFKYLNKEDIHQLDLNKSVEKLYLVKWKDLSYEDITWQKDSNIKAQQKIEEFKKNNKYPSAQIEYQLQNNIKSHKLLLQLYQKEGKKERCNIRNNKIIKLQEELYHLGIKNQRKVYTQEKQPIYKNYKKLKSFQLQSLNWMTKNWHCNRNSILADQMGLGKTIQTIAFLYHLYHSEEIVGPFLILAPLTTLHQWRRQIQQWTSFNCLLYCDQGSSDIRQIIRGTQFYYSNLSKNSQIVQTKIPKFNVLLTNYEIFIKDYEILKEIAFQQIVLDEAHRLKNKMSKLTTTLNKLPCCRKLLLTGTPIQNNTKELWTLLNFIEPEIYSSIQQFENKYGKLENDKQVKEFRQQIKPYILRRIKQDVQTTIPKLSELIISVEMTNEQKKYYRGLLEKNKKQMVRGLNGANFNLLSVQLRKCCNHPYLIASEIEETIKNTCQNEQQERQAFMNTSGKIILLLKLLEKFKKQGKKVLVFSQFVTLLELIKPFLESYQFNCELLKGALNATLRHQAISRFNLEANKTDVFLISTKAGGVGINLISASQVIIFDSDWNPQNDIQATARAHRIGQKKQVTVYRLITANSYESEMFEISSRKLGLDKAIFTGEFFKSSSAVLEDDKILNKQQIETLLKKGILGFLENQNNNQQYFNQSIEEILEKNTKKIEYITNQSSFSKTTFKIKEKQEIINIDAPDFWEKALRNVETPLDKLIRKIQEIKTYDTIEKQQELMVEAYQVTYVFVKQKTINASFNAEDEFNLIRFFKSIQNERNFHKRYHHISNELKQEIQKPSRRFRVKLQDLYLVNLKHEEDDKQHSQIQQISEGNQSQQILNSNINEDNKLQKNKCLDIRTIQNYEKLCNFCWRPKCLYFCKGICGKAFHKVCWDRNNIASDQKPCIAEINEKELNFKEWQENVVEDMLCNRCQSQTNNYECAICLKIGTCDMEMNNHKQKYRKFSNQLSGDMVFKCNMRNCHYFFHINCLFSEQFKGKFADKAGKVVKDIKDKSILFRCPAHYCFMCYGQDIQFNKSRPTNCQICFMTIHLKCMRNNQLMRIRKSSYICTKHLLNPLGKNILEDIKIFFQNKEIIRNLGYKGGQDNYKQTFSDRIKYLKNQRNNNQQIENPTPSQNKMKLEITQPKQENRKVEIEYSYKDFGVAPITEFDFFTYKGNWCRYCGSRFSQMFKKGPWGKNKLCYHHYTSWRKKKLNLSSYRKEPRQPIDKSRDTQIRYLNLMQQELNLKPIQTILHLKQIMIQKQLLSDQKCKKSPLQKQKQQKEELNDMNESAKSEQVGQISEFQIKI